jgi:hypothetical protein
MRLWAIIAGLMVGSLATAWADAPVRSVRPELRPAVESAAIPSAMSSVTPLRGAIPELRPVARPIVAQKPARVVLASSGSAIRISPRPAERPQNLKRRNVVLASGMRSQPATPVLTGKRGAVCGDTAIQGQKLAPIPGRLKGCGVPEPVRITSVDGVALTQPATMNCATAKALKRWVAGTVKPEVGRLGGGVASLRVAAHYSCRTRNNQPGAKISEHGRGKAIDIAAINLNNGVSLTVLKGWNDPVQGPILRRLHKAACGTFGTVLGPKSDRFHQDHFHLDTARHRGGSYCR